MKKQTVNDNARRLTELRFLEEIRQRVAREHTDTLSAAVAILAEHEQRILALEKKAA